MGSATMWILSYSQDTVGKEKLLTLPTSVRYPINNLAIKLSQPALLQTPRPAMRLRAQRSGMRAGQPSRPRSASALSPQKRNGFSRSPVALDTRRRPSFLPPSAVCRHSEERVPPRIGCGGVAFRPFSSLSGLSSPTCAERSPRGAPRCCGARLAAVSTGGP